MIRKKWRLWFAFSKSEAVLRILVSEERRTNTIKRRTISTSAQWSPPIFPCLSSLLFSPECRASLTSAACFNDRGDFHFCCDYKHHFSSCHHSSRTYYDRSYRRDHSIINYRRLNLNIIICVFPFLQTSCREWISQGKESVFRKKSVDNYAQKCK